MPICAAFAVPHPPVIIPEIGQGRERGINATIQSFGEIAGRISAIAPETIVYISPHSVMYADYIHVSPGYKASGGFARFGAARVNLELAYDADYVRRLNALFKKEGVNAGTDGERDASLDHGVLVPAYFINRAYNKYKAVRVSISGLSFGDHYKAGELIAAASEGTGTVIIASGDLSHKLTADGPYGFAKEGPEFDAMIVDIFKSGDLGRLTNIPGNISEKAAECGLRGFIMMAGALNAIKTKPEFLSYEGPFGVGYCCAAFTRED